MTLAGAYGMDGGGRIGAREHFQVSVYVCSNPVAFMLLMRQFPEPSGEKAGAVYSLARQMFVARVLTQSRRDKSPLSPTIFTVFGTAFVTDVNLLLGSSPGS